jgi:nitric oxide reductase subunit B
MSTGSMTEWLVLAQLLYAWIKRNSSQTVGKHQVSYRLLVVTDIWIIANVFIALLISIPAINLFTHGTHITVAHSMGTTIGINTSILIASLYYAIGEWTQANWRKSKRVINLGKFLFHLSLAVFLISLMILGYYRGQWIMYGEDRPFSEFFNSMNLLHQSFYYAGSALAFAIILLIWPAFKSLLKLFKQ